MIVSKKLSRWAYAWNVLFGRTPYSEYHEAGTKEGGRYGTFSKPAAYPTKINLCNLLWRTFVVTPLLGIGGIFAVTAILTFLWDYLPYVLGVILAIGIGVSIVFGIVQLAIHYKWGRKLGTVADNVIGANVWHSLAKAKKNVCPYYETEK